MHNILSKNVPVFVPVFLFTVTVLTFQIKRIISSEKWFNYVVTSFFFLKMPKKEDGLMLRDFRFSQTMLMPFFCFDLFSTYLWSI